MQYRRWLQVAGDVSHVILIGGMIEGANIQFRMTQLTTTVPPAVVRPKEMTAGQQSMPLDHWGQ